VHSGTTTWLHPWWEYVAIYVPFVFALGAIVGSFLNVVVYRLPAGLNIISPPSQCPKCSRRLRWHENLPIVGWIRLRGRCAACRTPISIQYPLVEAFTALLFTAMFALDYLVDPSAPGLRWLVPTWTTQLSGEDSWPLFILHLVLVAALVAVTLIDARTYTIPIEIPVTVVLVAFLVHAAMPLWPAGGAHVVSSAHPEAFNFARWTLPLVGPVGVGCAAGGMLGVLAGRELIRRDQIRPGFLDYDLHVAEDDEIVDYPHGRREMLHELDYVVLILVGAWLGARIMLEIDPGPWLRSRGVEALGSSMIGYLVGGALIWLTRIAGTLGFGREAMGAGDIHLLAAIGAVLGWLDAVLVFFLAPLLALSGIVIASLLRVILPLPRRYIPFGPWLAGAAVLVMFGDPWLEAGLSWLVGTPIVLP